VSALCDRLSGASEGQQSALLADSLMRPGRMEDLEWRLLLRVLLRTVSVGVGPQTVLSGLSMRAGPAFFARQRSLKGLAEAHNKNGDDGDTQPSLLCGVPFVPMNGDALAAPYLMPWIFSREEKLAKPITPFDGRLVIFTDRQGTVPKVRWYTPLNNSYKLRMVNVEEDRVLEVKSRTRHILLLRAFKEAKLLRNAADGLMIHYTLSDEENGLVVMLLRAVTNAMDAGVELSGTYEDAIQPPPRHRNEEDEEEDGGEGQLPDLESLIAQPMAADPKLSIVVFKALGRKRYDNIVVVVVDYTSYDTCVFLVLPVVGGAIGFRFRWRSAAKSPGASEQARRREPRRRTPPLLLLLLLLQKIRRRIQTKGRQEEEEEAHQPQCQRAAAAVSRRRRRPKPNQKRNSQTPTW
jgi:hypothetical protein